MSCYAQRAIYCISGICMSQTLVLSDLGFLSDTLLPHLLFRMQSFAANALCPYESNGRERVESPCTAALSFASAYTS